MKKLKKFFKNNEGMTLIETIIGIFLISIASLMLVSGIMTSFKIVKEATDIKNESANVSTILDLDKGTPVPQGITMTSTKGTVKLTGDTMKATNDKGVIYYVYIADGIDY